MVEIWIGNQQADYGGDIETQYSVGDIRNFQTGNLNTSYDVDLPLTETNKNLLSNITNLSVFNEPSGTARIYVNGIEIIKGVLSVLSYNNTTAKVLISSDDWLREYKEVKLSDLDLSAYDQTYNTTNVEASWTAAAGEFIRYPLVYWGKLDFDGTDWYASDFLPWFNVRLILSKIFAGYTISSTFFDSTYFKSIYVLCKEPVKSTSYLDNKKTEVQTQANDNQQITVIAAGASGSCTMEMNPAIFDIVVFQGQYDNISEVYEIPETGTYRFQFIYQFTSNDGTMTVNDSSWTVKIIRNPLVGANVDLVTASGTTTSATGTLDTGYINLIQGDEIYCYAFMELDLTNSSGVPRQAQVDLTSSTFKAYNDPRILHIGLGYTIEPEKMMYDITQYNFISAIKKFYNLKIWLDANKKTIYLEPQPTFNTTNVIDITDKIDYIDHDVELVSGNYSTNNRLMFTNDLEDFELNNYNKNNTLTLGEKVVTLTSLYAEKTIKEYETIFSTFVKGLPNASKGPDQLPRILRPYDTSTLTEPNERPSSLNIKIGEWKGSTASASSWTYEGGTETNYPKIDALDFATLYPTYFVKMFHYIDKGKIVTMNGIADPLFINQLQTVISDSTKEGFRPLFKFYWQNEYHYGILNKYSTNGIRCKYELILVK